MDLYCPKCGEPWENDSLHDEVAARQEEDIDATYKEVAADFRSRGCEVMKFGFDGRCSAPSEGTDRTFGLTRQAAASALYDVLGDDMDGAAAMLDDMGF